MGVTREALRSIPEEPSVAYEGNGFSDLLIIFICTGGMPTKIDDRVKKKTW
jgi:hypothetical protein